MLFAKIVTQFPDAVIGAFAVVIFFVFDIISGTKNYMIMNMFLVDMGGYYIKIFPL